MKNRPVTIYQKPQLDSKTRRALFACGLWMRLGFVGASAVAVGVIQLFQRDTNALSALTLAAGGAALAFLSWRRAHTALAAMGDDDTPVTSRGAANASSGVRTAVGA